MANHGGADPSLGHIDNALQAHRVRRVVNERKVGGHILNFLAVKEAVAANDLVGNTAFRQGNFNIPGLGIHSVQDCVVAHFAPGLYILQNLLHNKGGLVCLVLGSIQNDLAAGACIRPQALALSIFVIGDHRVGAVQNILGGAVVLLQANHCGVLIMLLKRQNILNGGAAEAVNGLVIITDHANVLKLVRQQRGEHILGVVGVLVLVHHHIAELVLVQLQHIVILSQQLHGVVDHIVKVHSVRRQ